MEADNHLKRLLAKVPRLRDALGRVPHVHAWMKRLTGTAAAVWDPTNLSDLTSRLTCAALQLQVEALAGRIEALESERDERDRQYEASRAAEAVWTCRHISGDTLFLGNSAGQVARIPLALALRWRSYRPDSLSDTAVRGGEVLFMQGASVVARIPRSLFAVLPKVLESCHWLPNSLSPPRGGSPSPRSPAGVEVAR